MLGLITSPFLPLLSPISSIIFLPSLVELPPVTTPSCPRITLGVCCDIPLSLFGLSTSSGFCTFLPASGVTSGCPALGRSGSCALTFGTALALAAAASMSGLTLVSISGLTLVGLTSAGRLVSMSGFLVTSTSFGRLFGDATSLGLSC